MKRSIDARAAPGARFVHIVDVSLPAAALGEAPSGRVRLAPEVVFDPPLRAAKPLRPVVIGLGPCGLFAALHLALAGAPPIVLDRGKPVETRAKDVAALLGKGVINESSNLCYGEGGAGTWSDGKLYTRVGGALFGRCWRRSSSSVAPSGSS